MVGQDLPLQEPLASEVTSALIEFGRLSQHAGSAAFDALSALADELLKRLVALCKAQRGAVLLIGNLPDALLKNSQPPTIVEASVPDQQRLPSSAKPVRTLALYALSEEEVYALLTSFPAATPVLSDTQTASDMSCWITYRLAIGDMLGEAEKSQESGLPSEHNSRNNTRLPLQALLVLGWEGLEEDTSGISMERGRSLLPFVADAASGVIVSILLAERVHTLETKAQQEAAREAERLKAELLGTMNHELRSPLAAIKGYAATLMRHEKRLSREERYEFLSAINQASDRLEIIIERLLEMSELEVGELLMNRSPVDLVHLAGEAIASQEERVAGQFPGRFTFKLSIEDANGRPSLASHIALVWADLRRLREVLDNLLENAIKYSPKGDIIKVILRPAADARASALTSTDSTTEVDRDQPEGTQQGVHRTPDMVEVCVCDNGIGIPGEQLERIFDRFHRVDTRLTREVSGLGLGLAICKRIVELHDGRIWAESSPGEGSKFHILLPVAQAEIQ
jgi:signal transduction histidine kinase